MPGYIVTYKWALDDVPNIKTFPERLKQAKAQGERMGIRVVGIWFTMGEYDMVAVVDAPDEQTLALSVLAQVATGRATTKTMRALSEEEFAQVVSKLP